MVNNEDNRRDETAVPETRTGIRDELSTTELTEYESWRMEFVQWAYNGEKSPFNGEGYSYWSVRDIINRVERFCEWFYAREDFTIEFTENHLDAYWHHLEQTENRIDTNRRTIRSVSLVLKYRGIDWKIPNPEAAYESIRSVEFTPQNRDCLRRFLNGGK